jgi:hypothetical protein
MCGQCAAKLAMKGAGCGSCCTRLEDLIADDPYQLTEEEQAAGAQVFYLFFSSVFFF